MQDLLPPSQWIILGVKGGLFTFVTVIKEECNLAHEGNAMKEPCCGDYKENPESNQFRSIG